MIEANDLKGAREAIGDRRRGQVVRVLKSVFLDQVQVVPLIEDLATHIWIELAEHADLGVLLGDQPLAHRGYLDEEVVIWQKEIRSEVLLRSTIPVPGDRERPRLVEKWNAVEVQK
jgi:hypothetical protein